MKVMRIAFWTALLVLVALAGAIAYLPIYLENHKDILEAGATQVLGWPVKIDGGVTLAWALRPSIAVTGLRIQNPDGAQNPDVALKGQNLQSLQPLISLDGLPEGPFQSSFHLTQDDAGYRFENIEGSIDTPPPLSQIAVSQGDIHVSADQLLSVSLEGRWKQTPATLTMQLAERDRQGDNSLPQFAVKATLGNTALSGDLGLALNGPRPRIMGDLAFTKLDLSDLAGQFAGSEQAAPPQNLRTTWLQRPLPMATLQAFDADLTLKADLVISERLQAKKLRVRVALDNGWLQLDRLSISLPGLRLTGQAAFDTRTKQPSVEVVLNADQVRLPQALLFVSPSLKTAGSLQKLAIKAEAQGETPEAVITIWMFTISRRPVGTATSTATCVFR